MLLRSCWLIDCVVFNVLFDSIIIHMEIPALMMKGCCGNGTSSCHKCSDAESRVMVSSEEPTTGVSCTTRASHDPYILDVCCDGFYMSIRYYVDMSRYICCTSTCSYSCFLHIEQGINIVTHEILFMWRRTTSPSPLSVAAQTCNIIDWANRYGSYDPSPSVVLFTQFTGDTCLSPASSKSTEFTDKGFTIFHCLQYWYLVVVGHCHRTKIGMFSIQTSNLRSVIAA